MLPNAAQEAADFLIRSQERSKRDEEREKMYSKKSDWVGWK